jgi:hypothetical protein
LHKRSSILRSVHHYSNRVYSGRGRVAHAQAVSASHPNRLRPPADSRLSRPAGASACGAMRPAAAGGQGAGDGVGDQRAAVTDAAKQLK